LLLPEARDEDIIAVEEVLVVWGIRWWSGGLWGGGYDRDQEGRVVWANELGIWVARVL